MKRKYITFLTDNGIEEILTFSELQDHSSIAQTFTSTRGWKVLSAGFIQLCHDELDNPSYSCYGKSVTLDVESRPNIDSRLINHCY